MPALLRGPLPKDQAQLFSGGPVALQVRPSWSSPVLCIASLSRRSPLGEMRVGSKVVTRREGKVDRRGRTLGK